MFDGKSILVTGGTGSFGHAFVPMTLAKYNPRRIIIFSRDEMKQWEMAKLFENDSRVRFFLLVTYAIKIACTAHSMALTMLCMLRLLKLFPPLNTILLNALKPT